MSQDKKQPDAKNFIDPIEFANEWLSLSQRLGDLWTKTLQDNPYEELLEDGPDPYNLQESIQKFWADVQHDPQKFMKEQTELWFSTYEAWQNAALKFLGEDTQDNQQFHDRRFASENWQVHPYFSFLKQAYLITSHWVLNHIKDAKGLSETDRKKLLFHTQQYIDALSPANFAFTNPDVLAETISTGGENLIKGLENLIEDLERGNGQLSISMTDYDTFKVGENLATTEGQVVFQNDLIQLIQYTPKTKDVYKTPLLIIPPWINKFYILDLNERKSFVKWLVEQGHTVFLISWVNPDERHKDVVWENYMFDGAMKAIEHIQKTTAEPQINVIGYCIGGTMLASLLAYLKAKKADSCIKSATFLTAMVDFEKSGDMRVFIDETQLKHLEEHMFETGFLDASHMKNTFSMMRANDLIWSFVINNYLMGKEPFAFDLLYWNDDSTNLCAKTHSFYLRNMYLKNALIEPGGVELGDVKIDVSKIDTPSYFLSTETDHITPWETTYTPTQLFKGPIEFTLGASGHIAGVVNPPASNKYHYYKNKKLPTNPQDWFADAEKQDGSWWPDWQLWIEQYTGEKVAARKITKGIEPAPGSYVKIKS